MHAAVRRIISVENKFMICLNPTSEILYPTHGDGTVFGDEISRRSHVVIITESRSV